MANFYRHLTIFSGHTVVILWQVPSSLLQIFLPQSWSKKVSDHVHLLRYAELDKEGYFGFNHTLATYWKKSIKSPSQTSRNQLWMDTAKRVMPPIPFVFYCSVTHVMSQVLQPKTVNKRYRGRHTFISVHMQWGMALWQIVINTIQLFATQQSITGCC